MNPKILAMILSLMCFALQGCGFIVEQLQQETERQRLLNKATNAWRAVETKADIDNFLGAARDRLKEIDEKNSKTETRTEIRYVPIPQGTIPQGTTQSLPLNWVPPERNRNEERRFLKEIRTPKAEEYPSILTRVNESQPKFYPD